MANLVDQWLADICAFAQSKLDEDPVLRVQLKGMLAARQPPSAMCLLIGTSPGAWLDLKVEDR